jgi:hypothetical protein
MEAEPKPGQKVRWSSHGGEAHGEVVGKITRRTKIKSHIVAASKDNPEFMVETNDGKRAAHKASALKRD